ncbi:DsbA family protein [Candidatus Woesearchaeota archaeon]|nr:DsbA family protein [Candidatus Woesearchaeota archaeon]
MGEDEKQQRPRSHANAPKRKEQSETVENIVAVSIFVVLMLTIIALFTNGFGLYNPNKFSGERVQVPYTNEPVRGNLSSARIVINVFSDFECPYCKKGEDTIMEVFNKYEGEVVLVFNHFPLRSIHPDAMNAALASECADEQGSFWEYHDMLFSHNNALGAADLKAYASEIGLEREQFDSCLDTQKYAFKVEQGISKAHKLGVTSTPTFFINGVPVIGAQPISEFEKVIAQELGK